MLGLCNLPATVTSTPPDASTIFNVLTPGARSPTQFPVLGLAVCPHTHNNGAIKARRLCRNHIKYLEQMDTSINIGSKVNGYNKHEYIQR